MTHLAGSTASEPSFKRVLYPPLPLGIPPSLPLSRLDTPLPVLGRRRSSLLAGLGLGLGHVVHGHGPPLGPIGALGGSARDSNSLPSFHRRGVSKRRSSSSRDDAIKYPKPLTPDQYQLSEQQQQQQLQSDAALRSASPPAPTRSSLLFSPYSPLPAIGGPSTSMREGSPRGSQGDADTDTDAGDKTLERPPRLLRERTYDVLEPRFVRGPSQDPAAGAAGDPDDGPRRRALLATAALARCLGGPDSCAGSTAIREPLRPSLPAALTAPVMIEDEELPTSPPALDDEDFDSALEVGPGAEPRATEDGEPPGVSVEDLGDCSDELEQANNRGSRSLQALKEGYKGKLRKFWSKF